MPDVNSATDDIRKDLHGTGWFGTTTPVEVQRADRAFRSLDPTDAHAVVSGLSDHELRHWADDTRSWQPSNGLSADERRDLLNSMAARLDGQQLARVAGAFGYDEVTAAVQSHASADTRAEYALALAPAIDEKAQRHPSLGSSTMTVGNDAAKSAASVLAGLGDNPAAFDHAVNSLSTAGKLDAVLRAATGESDLSGSPSLPVTTLNPGALDRIVDSAARSPDLGVRTAVFKSTTPALRDMQDTSQAPGVLSIEGEHAAQGLASSMSHLLTKNEARADGLLPVIAPAPPPVSLQMGVQPARNDGALRTTQDVGPDRYSRDDRHQGV